MIHKKQMVLIKHHFLGDIQTETTHDQNEPGLSMGKGVRVHNSHRNNARDVLTQSSSAS